MEFSCFPMPTNTGGTTKMASLMERVFMNGPMELSTKVFSKTGSGKDKAAGSAREEISTKAISVQTAKTGRGSLDGPTATFIPETSAKTCDRAMGRWSGEMEVFTRDSGDEDYRTAEVIDCIISQEPSERLAKNPGSDTSKTIS